MPDTEAHAGLATGTGEVPTFDFYADQVARMEAKVAKAVAALADAQAALDAAIAERDAQESD